MLLIENKPMGMAKARLEILQSGQQIAVESGSVSNGAAKQIPMKQKPFY